MGLRVGDPVGGRKRRKRGPGGQQEELRMPSSGCLPNSAVQLCLAKAISSRVNTVGRRQADGRHQTVLNCPKSVALLKQQ